MDPTLIPAVWRSPLLLDRARAVLVVIDVQQKLAPLIDEPARLAWNIRRMIDAAKLFGVPVLATEQYPQGLGPTVPELAAPLAELGVTIHAKQSFSCCGSPAFVEHLLASGRTQVILVGMETHVCVQQTALDLLAQHYAVHLPVDAIAARGELDDQTALSRMECHGATITTVEAVLFELCGQAGTPEFKEISRLVREKPPQERG